MPNDIAQRVVRRYLTKLASDSYQVGDTVVTTYEAQTLRETDQEFSLHQVVQALLTRYVSLRG